MDSPGYTSLTRQSGLLREMQSVANNIANVSTTGFRRQGIIFAEHVHALEPGEPSLSMATASVRHADNAQGAVAKTGGTFDFAIEGDGFFMVETPEGQQLTRAGSFTPNPEGDLVAPDGARLLDSGGAPVFVPTDAKSVSLSADGTLSADGIPLTEIGLFVPADPTEMSRREGVRFAVDGDLEPVAEPVILQGFLENSNVNPVSEIARMIQVQHAYQMGQQFMDKEDERIRSVLQTLSR